MVAGVLSRNEAALYLRVCKTTLDRLDIPRVKVRRRVLFKKAVLDAWLDEHTTRKGTQA
jgi:excisionase family DNA binding protein